MTFLQQSLGKNYKWWYILKYASLSESGNKLGFFAKYLASFLTIVSSLYIWSLVDYNSELFTYLLVGKIYFELTSNNYFYRLSNLIVTGKINKLLYPVNFSLYQYFEALGIRIIKNLLSIGGTFLGVIFCTLTFAKINIIWNFLAFLILLTPITFSIYQFLGIILGSLFFWIKNPIDVDSVHESFRVSILVLAGTLIPLSKLPFGLSNFFEILPTSYFLHHPMQIYLGKYNNFEILQTFEGGIAWCFVLWILARLIFKAGLKKNEAVRL